jgi:hypothetical protein
MTLMPGRPAGLGGAHQVPHGPGGPGTNVDRRVVSMEAPLTDASETSVILKGC